MRQIQRITQRSLQQVQVEGVKAMELFGRELSLEQMVGLVECNATPDEDLVHRAALEIIAALRESQRRERAAVEDLRKLDRREPFGGKHCAHKLECYEENRKIGGNYPECESCTEWQWRGPQDEDAEEQGRLVRVPCKIGDTVWAIRSYHGILCPQQGVVSEMYFRLDMTLQIVVKHVTRGELGRTVFLTREEAEEALKENSHE
jgi:hypothetical protein